jgi:hypothetical protein
MGDVDVKLPHRLEKCVYPQRQYRCLFLGTTFKKEKPARSLLISGGACDAPDLLHVLQHESQAPEALQGKPEGEKGERDCQKEMRRKCIQRGPAMEVL